MFYLFFGFGGACIGSGIGMLLALIVTSFLGEWMDMGRYALLNVCLGLIGIGAILGVLVGVSAVYKGEAKRKQK